MDQKIILITGASSGMGKESALKLIQEGHIVYGAARRVEKMQPLAEAGGKVVKMDVTDEDSMVMGVTQIIKEQGRIDVLVNNAGYAIYGAVEDTSMSDARRQFDVNLFGLARLTQLVLPHMRKQQAGKIINITSMGGKIYTPLGAWYHATKHALEGWSDCLRIELKQFNIDVVVVEPGAIATEFGDVMLNPLLERSGQGPYRKMAQTMADMTRASYQKKNAASPPAVISQVISKAIKAKKPKTRYAAGKMAKSMMFMRKWLGDRVFDAMLFNMIK
ncbi:MAG: oxidoreductase [Spirochaetes bacterium]|nr:oxidoreductase [Spirochaetota bacterium]